MAGHRVVERAFGGRIFEVQAPSWKVDQVTSGRELDVAGDASDTAADDPDLEPVRPGHSRRQPSGEPPAPRDDDTAVKEWERLHG